MSDVGQRCSSSPYLSPLHVRSSRSVPRQVCRGTEHLCSGCFPLAGEVGSDPGSESHFTAHSAAHPPRGTPSSCGGLWGDSVESEQRALGNTGPWQVSETKTGFVARPQGVPQLLIFPDVYFFGPFNMEGLGFGTTVEALTIAVVTVS